MNKNDLQLPGFFTKDGTDIWKLESYCLEPTCKLRNLETGAIEDMAISSYMAGKFTRIKMPVEPSPREVNHEWKS